MKRIFLSLAILGVCSIGIFAQETEVKKNTFGYSFTLIGAELHYERNFNDYLSVLGSVSYTTLFFVDEFTISAKGRWYPFGKIWYLGLGAGYMYGGVSDHNADALGGLLTASLIFPPLIVFLPLILIGEVAEFMKSTSRESGFLVQTNMGWKIPPSSGRKWALLIDTGLDINVTGISRSIAGTEGNTTNVEDNPRYLLHFLLPYIRIGFDFKF